MTDTPEKPKDDDDLIVEALKRFEDAIAADQENRDSALDDLNFVAGDQWDAKIAAERKSAGRPMLKINRLPQFVRQVSNEIRMQPPAISVSPSEGGDARTAYVIEGLIRSIEQASGAKRVYARAAEDAARGNMGFWRIKTEYKGETFYQDIRIEPIRNNFSVVFDPAAKDPTCRDAGYAFVYDDMPKADFKAKYPKAAANDFEGDRRSDAPGSGWVGADVVRVAEYWTVENEPVEIVLLSDGSVIEADDQEAMTAALQAGLTEAKRRTAERKKVEVRIISGSEVLEGPKEWAGDRIPVIPAWGEEIRIGTRRVRNSVITNAKDPQRQLNYWETAATERIALAPKAPWLGTPKMFEGHENEWMAAATGNPFVLPYNPDSTAPTSKPERIAPAPIEAAMLQAAASAAENLKATTGIYDAALGAKSNETSGKAIVARQKEGDVGTFTFVDNILEAVEETGRIIVQLIPKIYDTPRMVRILGKRMEPIILRVNQEFTPDGSSHPMKYDLTAGCYDVAVSTGPSVTTQRQETATTLTEVLRAAPQLAPAILPRLAQVIDLPDAEDFAAEVKQLVTPQQQPVNPKDAASADKLAAEADGQRIQNYAASHALGLEVGALHGLAPNQAVSPQGQPSPPQAEPVDPGAFSGG